MLSRKLWLSLAAVLLGLAVWHAFQPVDVIYSRRTLADGTVRVSGIQCGNGMAMVFAGEYSDDILGPATQEDCLRAGRTHVAEVFGLVMVMAVLVYVGMRFGRPPPRPIRSELPDLPSGERSVFGRRQRQDRAP